MSTVPLYPLDTAPNNDNTERIVNNEYQNPAYTATIALKLKNAKTVVQFGTLTGALALSAETTRPLVGSELVCLFLADATGRTVTFGAGFAFSAATLVLGVSKRGTATFTFDGVSWVETGRSVQA